MTESQFDTNVFLDAVTTEAGSRRPPLPVGDYIATVGEPKFMQGPQKKDPTKNYQALNVPLEVDVTQNPAARQLVGQDKVVLFHFVGLDFNEGGMLDWGPGRNRNLLAYREALDLNTPGQPFSPRMIQGKTVRVKVNHETYEGEIRERVGGVAKV